MAVYCGVCATRIFSAPENEGSFQVVEDFGGWDKNARGGPQISDTCERCAEALRKAVARAARTIARKRKKHVDALREEIAGHERALAAQARDKAEFEREWQERQRKKGSA